MLQEYFDLAYNYVQHQLTTNQFFSAAALSSVGLGALYYLKSVPMQIWSRIRRYFFYSMTIEQDSDLFRYLNLWVQANHKQDLRHVEGYLDDGELKLTHENDYTIFWYRKRRIKLSKTKQRFESPMNADAMFQRSYTISGLFSRSAILHLMNAVIAKGLEHDENRKAGKKDYIKIYNIGRWGGFDNGIKDKSNARKPFSKLYLKNKEEIIADIEHFKDQKETYEKLGVPYKRGYMFHGAPGNGKSSIAYAMAQYLKYDIYIIDMAMIKDGDFSTVIKAVEPNSVVVIEDIDNFYNKREPAPDNKVNFSTFLNSLSGIGQKDNIITVFTTNNIDKVDDALLRSGRCDIQIELTNPDKQLVEKYLSDMFDQEVLLDSYESCLSFANIQKIVLDNLDNLDKIKTLLTDGTGCQNTDSEEA